MRQKNASSSSPPPELTEREEELLRIHRRLNNFWRNSCYYMDDEPEAQEIPEVKIMTYRDRLAAQEKAKTEKKAELHDVLESYKDHFPEELWAGRGKKRKRGAGDGASKGARAIGGAADSDDRLERLARLEQEKGVGEEDVDDDVEKAAGDEDEDDEGTGKRGRPRVSENADRKPRHSENKDGKKGGDKVGDDDDGDEDDFWDDDDASGEALAMRLSNAMGEGGDTPCLFSEQNITASPRRKSLNSVRVPSPSHVANTPPPPSSLTSRCTDTVSTLPWSLWFSSVTPPPLE